ncbi:hypothetical protein M433DRAFT_132520 [Acidomyces richmondensis BFW]|nr:MAG: hypothetical protein FE78DRAFT_139176 [Acidomyces sp. 'richmondensis']KYG47960.1 hypothetical protein M433DRAFT_132520 [Acidomyces richmondensis BFW]
MPGLPFNNTLGETIPPDTPHAVSVSLPTWQSNVGYEEGESWVLDKMQCGYPRFFIHKSIERLALCIVEKHCSFDSETAMLFPSRRCATRCVEFMKKQAPNSDDSTIRILDFVPNLEKISTSAWKHVLPHVTAVVYPKELFPISKAFWQHTGEGISSRRAEFCQQAFDKGLLVEQSTVSRPTTPRLSKGPKRYQRPISVDHGTSDGAHGHTIEKFDGLGEASAPDSVQFIEERFGRNLDVTFAAQAKLAIRKRIAGSLTVNVDQIQISDEHANSAIVRSRDVSGFSVEDVYLYPMGMNAIYHAHRSLMLARGDMPSVMYGFPYVDTLKVLQKFGPGATFYGFGSEDELDDLENRLKKGEKYLSLFCEFPGNPLLRSPNLHRIRNLANEYDFAVVVDETIGNFLNVHVLPYADVVVSSLTKIFSGDSNVMGGSMVLNPHSRYYSRLKEVLSQEYEDNQFEEDSVYLERNSRDFVTRIHRVDHNAELIADVLYNHPAVKQVNYPKYSDTKQNYDACKVQGGGYGGLLSATFYHMEDAQIFYDHLNSHKGPSLGTNFTLSSPFVILAHYNELDWAAKYGCDASLVRFSVGLENPEVLKTVFENALAAIPKRSTDAHPAHTQ